MIAFPASRPSFVFLTVSLILLVANSIAATAPAPLTAEPATAQSKEADDDRAIELYYSANALYNRKLYSLAAEEYGDFLEKHPSHDKAPRVRLGLALCHYSLGDKKKAEPLFARLTEERGLKNQQEIHNLWGQCLLGLDRPAEAQRAFEWSLRRGSDHEQKELAGAGLTEALYCQSKWPEVIRSFERFRKENPESERLDRVAFQAAVAYFELTQFSKAGALLETITIKGSKSGFGQHVTFLLAECRREQGDFDAAERLFNKAAYEMTGAFGAESLFRLGFVRFQLGDYAKAKRNFTDLIDNHPASPHAPSAKIYLGRAHLQSGKYSQAEKEFASFSPKDEGYTQARLWLARTHRAQQKFSPAGAVLADAIKRAPKSPMRPDLLYELATVQMDLTQFANAAVTFRKLGREFPKSPLAADALWLEAFSLHKAGKYLDSADRCGNFLSLHPKNERCGEVAFLNAENLYLIDERDEAESCYARFLKKYGSHAYSDSARFRLAQIGYQKKEWPRAIGALRVLIEKEVASPFFNQLYFILGDCYFSLDQWDNAIEALRLFVEKHPDEPNADRALLKVALAAVNKGDDSEAEAALEDFERRYPKSAYLDHALVERGRLHYEAGEYSEAQRVFTLAASTGKSPFATYYLAYVALATDDETSALAHFSSLEKQFPRHELVGDALLQQGIIEVRRGDYAKGEATLGRLADGKAKSAQSDQALFYRAIAQARQGKWTEGARAFENLTTRFARSPLRDRALYEWAWCEREQDRGAEAIERYEELLASHPESALVPEVLFELAELEYDRKLYDKAIGRLRSLAARDDVDDGLRERTYYRLGWNHYSKGDLAGAARWFEEMINEFGPAPLEQGSGDDESPDQMSRRAVALYQAGEARLQLKEYEPAYGHFKALAESRGAGQYAEQALLRLGECAALTQRWQESENVFRRFVGEYEESEFLGRALFGQGWAMENQARYSEAVKAYKQVLTRGKKDETSARSQFQIGECLFSQKEYDEAVKALIKVEVIYAFPEWSAKALLESGRALEIPGKKAEASARYREVIDKYPDSHAATVARQKLDKLENG